VFFQDAPQNPDLYVTDLALQAELARRLPASIHEAALVRCAALGVATADELPRLATQAEAQPPQHIPYDPWGRRVDEIRTSPAWEALRVFSARRGLVASGYDASFGEHRRVVQAALLHLFSASSATYSCPLAMTDAAARVLIDLAPTSLRERLVPGLTTTDPARFITSGQWMTERTGGSDVGNTETIARPAGAVGEERRYTLHGAKWFTSATTSEMALTLARIDDGVTPPVPGSRGLSLFCVEISRVAGEGWRGITVHRLKDKLGTKALPTAELTLDGAPATMLGEPGRGVANISGMLNVTRLYNAIASASGMHRACAMARDYAQRRSAFGHKLADLPLHATTLADMEAEAAAALALVMACASLLGRSEAGVASEDERRRLRALIPLAKLTTAKQAVAIASEALECFGGAGYVEDTGLPRLLRDAQVLPIWEGTTNVLSLDVLRAEAKDGSFSAVLKDMSRRAELLARPLDRVAVTAVRDGVRGLVSAAQMAVQGGREALEANARKLALRTGHVAEALYLADTAAVNEVAAERFRRFAVLRFGA